jgi:hypothetical protein
MTKFLLIRHGHVEGIKPERLRGPPVDIPHRLLPFQLSVKHTFRLRRLLGALSIKAKVGTAVDIVCDLVGLSLAHGRGTCCGRQVVKLYGGNHAFFMFDPR